MWAERAAAPLSAAAERAGPRSAGRPDAADGKRFLHTADLIYRKLRATKMLPRKITIHRYYPKKPLGGLLGMLNFDRSVIDAMIEQGYRDACEHECVDKRTGKKICVIPHEAPVALTAGAGS